MHGLERARSCNYGYPTRCGRVSHAQNERSFPSPDELGKAEGRPEPRPASSPYRASCAPVSDPSYTTLQGCEGVRLRAGC